MTVKDKAPRTTFNLIQVLRAAAALAVVAHHATTMGIERLGASGGVWRNGAAGVDVFFVISGFAMALSSRSLMRGSKSGLEFLKRRAERIVPLYWLMTTLKVILLAAFPVAAVNPLGGAGHVIGSYLFLSGSVLPGQGLPVLVVGWTLNLEMFFYVLFALALGLRIRPMRLLAPVLTTLAVLPLFAWTGAPAALRSLLNPQTPIVLEFLFGIALFEAWKRGVRVPAWAAVVGFLTGAGAILLTPFGSASIYRPLVWGVPALLIVGAAVVLEPVWGRRAPAWAREMGDASYSIYLVQTFALPVAGVLLLRLGVHSMSAAIAGGLSISLAAGEAVYRWVELPLIRYFRGRRVAAVASGT